MQLETKKTIKTTVSITTIQYPRVQKVSEGTWGILRCWDKENKKDICVTGELPKIDFTKRENNTTYSLIANEVNHPTYGMQYQIVYMQPLLTDDNCTVRNFLSYILTPMQVQLLYATYDNPLEYIKKKDIDALCKVKGIKEITAKKIIKKYEENIQYEQAYSELGQYNLTSNLIQKLLTRYGKLDKIKGILQNNPYQLIKDVKGIGWAKADEIGIKVGISVFSPKRIAGYIVYFLENQAESGNSWVVPSVITEGVLKLFTPTEFSEHKEEIYNSLKEAIIQLKEDDTIYFDEVSNKVFLLSYFNLERKIAKELIRLLDGDVQNPTYPIEEVVHEIENERGWTLTDEQINGAKIFEYSNVGVITGASGTGKSSTVEVLTRAFQGKSIAQVALAGRAASRLSEITGLEGSTIHRLLGVNENKKFMHNRNNQLNYDIIIVDEISMIGGQLFYSLIQAIPTGSKLILVGDHNQLESIGSLNLLKDLIDSQVIPVQILNKIHRQAQESGIITESFKVKDGESITNGCVDGHIYCRGKLQDFVLALDNQTTNESVIEFFKQEYSRLKDIHKIQVIVPMKERGNLSVDKINKRIQDYYNPASPYINEVYPYANDKSKVFREGDKVINVVNNYNCENTNGDTVAVFNGYIGIIDKVDTEDNIIIVDYTHNYGNEVGKVIYKKAMFNNLQLAYAITCHKFQGSEIDTVIVGIDYSAYALLCKQWVYTAITRSKKKCVLVADKKALDFAVHTNRVSTKQTFLPLILGGKYDLDDDLYSHSTDNEYEDESIDEY